MSPQRTLSADFGAAGDEPGLPHYARDRHWHPFPSQMNPSAARKKKRGAKRIRRAAISVLLSRLNKHAC